MDAYRTTAPEALLASVAAEVQSDIDADVLAEAAEILIAERTRTRLEDRVRATGGSIQVTTVLGERVIGVVQLIGSAVLVLRDERGVEHALAWASISRIHGLGPALRAEDAKDARTPVEVCQVTWGWWLRRCQVVDLHCTDGWRAIGRIAQVGADHVDVLVRDESGGAASGQITTIPFAAIARASAYGLGSGIASR